VLGPLRAAKARGRKEELAMTDRSEVVIVGAGQAGLAVSHELTQAGVAHVVLERGRVGQSWRRRWDSFCLVTPNWSCSRAKRPRS
jgi:putative flavoprotein involved in K+ transport